MSNHIADANKMVIDTPRTDEAEKHAYEFKDEYTLVCESKIVRQLERELNAANDRIKRLEDACDEAIAFCELLTPVAQTPNIPELVAKNLRKAKEAKP